MGYRLTPQIEGFRVGDLYDRESRWKHGGGLEAMRGSMPSHEVWA